MPRPELPAGGLAPVLSMALALSLLTACRPAPELPELYDVPPFALTSQADQPFSRDDLAGKVWVANFIFTSCPEICPLMTARMRIAQEALIAEAENVSFVSLSVDPATDTPARLTEYAVLHGATAANWFFLTGPTEELRTTVVDGFKQAVAPDPENPANILHGSHFVLVDGQGTIRGYYASTSQTTLDQLVVDVRRLLDS